MGPITLVFGIIGWQVGGTGKSADFFNCEDGPSLHFFVDAAQIFAEYAEAQELDGAEKEYCRRNGGVIHQRLRMIKDAPVDDRYHHRDTDQCGDHAEVA